MYNGHRRHPDLERKVRVGFPSLKRRGLGRAGHERARRDQEEPVQMGPASSNGFKLSIAVVAQGLGHHPVGASFHHSFQFEGPQTGTTRLIVPLASVSGSAATYTKVAISMPVGAGLCLSVPVIHAGGGVAYGARTRNLRSHNPMSMPGRRVFPASTKS